MKAHTHTHTSGPFPLVMHKSDSDNVPHLIVTNQGNHFASTYDPGAARLIAAAPDLLAACKAARDSLVEAKEMLNSCGAVFGMGLTFQKLETAIAKAERGAE
jgi:hypothetical protein